jgi:hypothetical protein
VLAAWGPLTIVGSLGGGNRNAVLELRRGRERLVARASRRPNASLDWKSTCSVYLASRGFRVPAIIPALDGRRHLEGVVVQSWLEGTPPEPGDWLPGAAAGVVHGDGLAWVAGAGFADTGSRTPSHPETLYGIAFITKTFTGTAIMQLRDAGRLDLDDPAVAHLPELRGAVSPFAAIKAVTIRRMLSHESGLATEPPGTDWSVPDLPG